MTDTDLPYHPFALWSETLASGDTARVYLSQHEDGVGVIAHMNGELYRYECCANLAEARQRGWEWWEEMFDPWPLPLESAEPARLRVRLPRGELQYCEPSSQALVPTNEPSRRPVS